MNQSTLFPNEAPLPDALANLHKSTGLYIDGMYQPGAANGWHWRMHPLSRKRMARVALAGREDMLRATECARAATLDWAARTPEARRDILFALSDRMQARARELAVAQALDTGHPVCIGAEEDLPTCADLAFHHAGWCGNEHLAIPGMPGAQSGVSMLMVPESAPLVYAMQLMLPRLVFGKAVILAASMHHSHAALKIGELCAEAGTPAGLVQILSFDPDHPEDLFESGKVDELIPFRENAPSPFLVFEDADQDAAADAAADALRPHRGSLGLCSRRFLVQETIREEWVARVHRRLEGLSVGDPLELDTRWGPHPSLRCFEAAHTAVEAGRNEGLESLDVYCSVPENGWFQAPVLFPFAPPASAISDMGAGLGVAGVDSFRSPQEAVDFCGTPGSDALVRIFTRTSALALWVAGQFGSCRFAHNTTPFASLLPAPVRHLRVASYPSQEALT